MRKPRSALWLETLLLGAGLAGAWALAHLGKVDDRGSQADEVTDAPGQQDLAAALAEGGVDARTLVVDFVDGLTDDELATNAWTEEPVSRYSARDRLYRLRFATVAAAAAARARLLADRTVESVDLDVMAAVPIDEVAVTADADLARECAGGGRSDRDGDAARAGFPDDPCYRYQWHMPQLGMPGAWKLGQGEGVVVAVIDTGVTRVPDLAATPLVDGYNFVADNANAADDHGHGTHVAGTIAQSTNNHLGVAGVAFKAKIMPVKVLAANGSGSMAGIAQGIRFAADNGAKVINMSLGGPFPAQTLQSAVKYARDRGVTVVAAAGNDGRGRVGYPAKYPGVLAVAATQFDEATTFYSNWGPEIDIAAPGGNVREDKNGDGKPDGVLQNTVVPGDVGKTDYLWFMGTSMASPHVAGVAALIVAAGVTKPAAVEKVLLDSARKPKAPRQGLRGGGTKPLTKRIDDHYGAGIADAGAALKQAKRTRGTGELGLGALFAATAATSLRRRRKLDLGAGGALALAAGVAAAGTHAFLGVPMSLLGASAQGFPLAFSAAPALLVVGLLYGVGRLRSAAAGFAFGLAGALAFTALAGAVDVRFVPDAFDAAWLTLNALAAALLGRLVLRRAY